MHSEEFIQTEIELFIYSPQISSNNCNGDSSDDFYGPGTTNIRGNMRDKSTSFKCYKN